MPRTFNGYYNEMREPMSEISDTKHIATRGRGQRSKRESEKERNERITIEVKST